MGRETRGDECSVLFHSTVHSEGEKKQKQDQKDREKWIVKKDIFFVYVRNIPGYSDSRCLRGNKRRREGGLRGCGLNLRRFRNLGSTLFSTDPDRFPVFVVKMVLRVKKAPLFAVFDALVPSAPIRFPRMRIRRDRNDAESGNDDQSLHAPSVSDYKTAINRALEEHDPSFFLTTSVRDVKLISL